MMKMEKPQTPLVLDIAGLTSHYGRIQALHGIDLQVRQGQLVALVARMAPARRPCCGPFPACSRSARAASPSPARTSAA